MKWFVKCLRHYADFRGRASMPEFWYFVLGLFLVLFLLLAVILGVSALCTVGATSRRYVVCLVGLPFVMPYLAGRVVSHFSLKPGGAAWLTDADLGLAILQGVYLIFLFYWWCRPGVPGGNRYGPDPKAE